MASKSEYITLVSKDDASFTVERDIAECSIFLRNLLNNDVGPDKPISIPRVDQFTLKRVLEWCTHHRSDPRPNVDGEDTTTDISEWDQKFIDESNGSTPLQLVLAANFLGIKPLFDLACNTVLENIIKSSDEICKTYGIKMDDFTPEEEDQMNEWADLLGNMIDKICKTYGIKMDFTPEEEDLMNEWVDLLGTDEIRKTYGIDFTPEEEDLMNNEWVDLFRNMIKGKSPDKIRKTYGIDSTPEELEEESAERMSGLTLE
ncbi:hypothetical protein Egran_01119 [Elaphomyces granulatus]|uniref:E3 ubiquitin ligase complex SCF subunit sconC n=1 Tax=Elaphomyces granulatus TaxID=519963 RepID=A0A232M4W9_9EURO|nr:hypothetical protein Egran_01119 [Elaphomyces granulatus]